MIRAATKIWLDGRVSRWEDANVHVLTHAFNHGTGVFEGIRCYNTARGPAIFRLRDHVERLRRSAGILLIQLPYSVDALMEATGSVVAVNGLSDCYIRMVAYRAYGEMGINLDLSPVAVSIAAWAQPPSFAPPTRNQGLRVTISSWRRQEPNTIPPQAKIIGAYVTASIARAEAVRAGFDEAIMLSPQGNISEATIENVFVVSNGELITPPFADSVLPGITRDTIITIAEGVGIRCRERSLTRAELYSADEIFLTGTGAEVVGVREVDGRQLGPPGPLTRLLAARYASVVRAEEEAITDWLYLPEMRFSSDLEAQGESH